jgi:beta-N-acetylhexosaminidase
LEIDLPKSEVVTPTLTLEPTPEPEYRVGDVIPLRAGLILDHNGNPVPDGTPITFNFTTSGETNTSASQVEIAVGGVAQTTFLVSNPGILEIIAQSENASSNILRIDIPAPSGEAPTETPTQPPPTATPTLTPTVQPIPTSMPVTTSPKPPTPSLSDWLIALLIAGIMGWSVYRLAAWLGNVRWGVRAGFLALIGSLLAYCYLALEMPGSRTLLDISVSWGVVIASFCGAIMGALFTILWRWLSGLENQRSTQ